MSRIRTAALGLALALAFSAPAGAEPHACDLDQAGDPQLQRALSDVVVRLGLGDAARRGDLALSLLVLTDPDRPRLAQINGDEMIYAASLPKIAILLGAAVAIDEGRLTPNDALHRDLQDMIRVSCNQCANRVLERVGYEAVLDVLRSPDYALYDELHGGGLWLGKPYGPQPAWARDPLHGLSHGATVFQAARFYCGLQQGTLVSQEQTHLMLDALSRPGIQHKFVRGLRGHNEIEMFRKSGTWRTFHADSALVRSDDGVYVIVGLAHSPTGGDWLERLAEPLHQLALAAR
jgi:beta-lactamase class A